MSITKEFEIANTRLNKLLERRKYSSDDWNALGQLDEKNIREILDGARSILHTTLQNIQKDYNVTRINGRKVSTEIEKFKNKVESELSDMGIIPCYYGERADKYGIKHVRSIEDVFKENEQLVEENIFMMDIQGARFRNYLSKRRAECVITLAPIIISLISLIVSIISLSRNPTGGILCLEN